MTLRRWLPTFLGFPIGGELAIVVAGPVDGIAAGALGGLLAGLVIGLAQFLSLRRDGVTARWVPVTAVALAAGTALGAALNDLGTAPQDLVLAGLAAGAAVGAAQSTLLGIGRRRSLAWTGATAVVWGLGWLTTWSIGVDVERGYHVFGSSGAVVVTVLTGLVLRRVLADRRLSPTGRGTAVTGPVDTEARVAPVLTRG